MKYRTGPYHINKLLGYYTVSGKRDLEKITKVVVFPEY